MDKVLFESRPTLNADDVEFINELKYGLGWNTEENNK